MLDSLFPIRQKSANNGTIEANILNGSMLSAGFQKGLYWDQTCF